MSRTIGLRALIATAVFSAIGLLVVSGASSDTALAQSVDDIGPRVAVPAPSASKGVAGCFRIRGSLYGNYQMSFCLGGRGDGTYQVSGGLSCRGKLDWYDMRNGNLNIDLARASCNRGQAWTGDSLSCKVDKPQFSVSLGKAKLTVPVPGSKTRYDTLNCTYNPVGYGYKPVKVTANRT